LAIVLDLLVLGENPIILYPLALISAAGVLILLTMIYSIMWLMIFKRRIITSIIERMFFPILSGFTVALFK
jgi:hypothetical protein